MVADFVPAFFYVIPIGMIQAITNQQVGLNVITELIIGFMLPGKPVAMMLFKTWGYITMAQALTFSGDMKLGHYMKIPPRAMFWAQVVATALAGTVQLGVQAWMFSNIPGICDDNEFFICPGTQTFGTASIIWGVIGPQRQFAHGQVYYALCFFFLIGALAPFFTWLVSRKYPNSFVKYVNWPVIFNGTGLIPPASAVNYVPWTIVAFIFRTYPRLVILTEHVLISLISQNTSFAAVISPGGLSTTTCCPPHSTRALPFRPSSSSSSCSTPRVARSVRTTSLSGGATPSRSPTQTVTVARTCLCPTLATSALPTALGRRRCRLVVHI
jgi:OPT family oligopeptide transporter